MTHEPHSSFEEMELQLGPQHPSTHGVLRFRTFTNGEIIRKAVPDVGYLHRGIEKIAEKIEYPSFMPYTDRVDYVSAMMANHAYARAVETLLNIEVPPRAQYLRMIADELCRIASHLIAVGTFPMDIGAVTPFVHALREREKINDLMEELCGARLTYNYSRIGGVAFDLPLGFQKRVLSFLSSFERLMEEFDQLISYNHIFIQRLAGIAPISKELALDYALAGPNLRGSGVAFDLRKNLPYADYTHIQFDVPVGKGTQGILGDSWDRYWVRIQEMRESSRILRQCLEKIPEGPFQTKLSRSIKPPVGEAYASVESARGEMGFFVISDGSSKPYRLKIRTGSFSGISLIEKISPGLMIAYLIVVIASLDLVAPEIDR